MSSLVAIGEERVDRLDLLALQWPLPRDTVLRSRQEIDLVPHALFPGELLRDAVKEYAGVLSEDVAVGRRLKRLPALRLKAISFSRFTEDLRVQG